MSSQEELFAVELLLLLSEWRGFLGGWADRVRRVALDVASRVLLS
jgi:hypothetical protein